MKRIEKYPGFHVEMGSKAEIASPNLLIADEMPLVLIREGKTVCRAFRLEEIKDGAVDGFLSSLEEKTGLEKAVAYVGPSYSFSSAPLAEKEAASLIESSFGAVKGGEGKNYYFDAKVATILALRKHGIEAERIFASPLSINEADGILDPKGENAYLIVLGG